MLNLRKSLEETGLDDVSPRGGLGTLADVCSFLTAASGVYVFFTKDDISKSILAAVVSLLAVSFICISFRLHKLLVESDNKHRRQVQDVKAMPLLSSATAHIARATVVAAKDGVQFVLHLNNACTDLAQAFSVATGSVCRLTVLEVYAPSAQRRPSGDLGSAPGNDLATRLLCASDVDRPQTDNIDWIVDNTDFDTIFFNGAAYFMSNDLPAEVGRGYVNSHWTRAKIAEFRSTDSWPYRSTIVWPIGSVPTAPPDARRDLVGFVCVDTVDAGIFDQDFDVPTGQTFAHAMYSGMATYRAAQRQAAQHTKPGSGEQT